MNSKITCEVKRSYPGFVLSQSMFSTQRQSLFYVPACLDLFIFRGHWHFRRPKVKIRPGHKLFVWWPIFASIAGQGQAHKGLKDEPVDCGLSCQCGCPGDRRVLPVEGSWWIKSHHWHAEGWSSLEFDWREGSHKLQTGADVFDGVTWILAVINIWGSDGSLASYELFLQFSCGA